MSGFYGETDWGAAIDRFIPPSISA